TGMNVNPRSLDISAMSAYIESADKVKSAGMVDFLLKLIPNTIMGAFSSGDVLQVLLVSILFGCALSVVGESGRPLVRLIDTFSHTLFKM
ncbi:MAG TPA: C4-dicarboxylate transporter DctA, partial [Cupriavidus sp.]|nr:C4-dicarboxylate transporter DctA [Cupriavidus sp.]